MVRKSPTPASKPRPPYEQGFLLFLLVLAIVGLLWLFAPFLPGLFLAILLATATYPLYRHLAQRLSIGSDKAALIMTVLIFFLVVSPLLYLLSVSAVMAGDVVERLRDWFSGFENDAALAKALGSIIHTFPLPEFIRGFLLDQASDNQEALIQNVTKALLFLFKGITDNSISFLSSLLWVVFSLFFFYRDGPHLIQKLRLLTPLPNHYDDFLLQRFSGLATVLTISTLTVSLTQGLTFATVTAFIGLPWFFLGLGLAVTSFIPILGGFILWGPLSYYLFSTGREESGVFLFFWGVIVNGFLIDNIFRPILIGRLSQWCATEDSNSDFSALDHTLLTTLATFGGIMNFGILGLFFGPVIAAMAIAVFELYEKIYSGNLDRS
ncbi:MAG: hypothetical protein HW380_3198 [Magnetococcales bacterium]|nr:hypothetical protein [Magnetococcales bacterium]HIJ85232.1 AI-2E family transporter [Magnetococcales bacterium]